MNASIIVGDWFCGAGGSSFGMKAAFDQLGINAKIYAINHWDRAIATHSANHADVEHRCVDLNAVDLRSLVPEGRLDILWASPSCFVAGTLILTERGLLPIERVEIGDRVLTHRGRWRPVTKTMKATKPTVTVSGQGQKAGIVTTAEHPFLTRTRSRYWNSAIRNWAIRLNHDESWTPAADLAGKFWATPTTYETLPIPAVPGARPVNFEDEAFWRVVGRWLGDGSLRLKSPDPAPRPETERDPQLGARCRACGAVTSESRRFPGRAKVYCNDACSQRHSKRVRGARRAEIHIVCGKSERAEMRELIGVGAETNDGHAGLRWREVENRTAYRYEAAHVGLARWLHDNFGEYAHGKHLPAWVFGMPRAWREALVDGYVSADGYDNGRVVRITSVSKALALGMRLLAESLGKPALFFASSRGDTAVIEGRVVKTRAVFEASWLHELKTNTVSETPNHRWSPVRSVEPGAAADVFNLSVADDESYVADGIVVHNCTEHSYAKGGRNIDDQKRASAWAVVHSIDAFRPKIIFVENVKPFVNWGPVKWDGRKKIWRPIATRKGETFRAWVAAIESMGYRVEWRFLNAADYGEAQTRVRFFLIARADGRRIAWPEATHSRDGASELFAQKKPWRAARQIIDRAVPAASIFERSRPLAPNTLARIEVGLKRFCSPALAEAFLVVLRRNADVASLGEPVPTVVAGGTHLGLAEPTLTPFVVSNQSNGSPRSDTQPIPTVTTSGGGGVSLIEPSLRPFAGANRTNNVPRALDEPLPPATTSGGLYVVEPSLRPFVLGQNGGAVARDVDEPLPTIATDGAMSIIEPYLIEVNHAQDGRPARSIHDPLPTVTAKNGVGMVEPFVVSYAERDGSGSGKCPSAGTSVDDPLPTVITRERFGLVEPFIVPQQGHSAASIDDPLDTVTTTSRGVRLVEPFLTAHFGEREGQEPRVHSIDAPLPTVTHRGAGDYVEPVIEPANEPRETGRVVEIDGKLYVLDIRFRMLQPRELARAQGFPDDYVFTGNKSEQTAQIGNAVSTRVARALVESVVGDLFLKKKSAA